MSTTTPPGKREYMRRYRQENAARIKEQRRQYAASEYGQAVRKAWKDANREEEILKQRARALRWYHNNKTRKKAYDAAYRAANRDKISDRMAKWRGENQEHIRAYDLANRSATAARSKAWKLANPERFKAKTKAWREENRDAARAIIARRRATKKARTAIGLPKGWDVEIYAEAVRRGLNVDHIVPLHPCRVCGAQGLHEPSNLQFLTPQENQQKSNRCHSCWKADSSAGTVPPSRQLVLPF